MALELRQQLKLSQQLVMTPQLQQAIKLLQLSRLELVETVQQEMMENPMLEERLTDEEIPDAQIPRDSQSASQERESVDVEAELVKNAEWDDYLGEFSSGTKQSLGRELEIPEEGLSLEARARLFQQLGQRTLVLLIGEQGQQILLLQCELACQLPVRVGGMGTGGTQQGQQ